MGGTRVFSSLTLPLSPPPKWNISLMPLALSGLGDTSAGNGSRVGGHPHGGTQGTGNGTGISIESQELLLAQFCTRISRENASSFGVTTNPLSLVSN